jgi:DNA-directed RNA polymerase specialized sigma24 family protein
VVTSTIENGRSRPISLSKPAIDTLIDEAARAAARAARRWRLTKHDREDLHQEILLDLLQRLKWFDESRGSLGAFAGRVARNQANRIAQRVARTNLVQVCTAPEDLWAIRDGSSCEAFAAAERAIDEHQIALILRRAELDLGFGRTSDVDPRPRCSRATRYRRLRDIHLTLLMAGLPLAA